MNWRYRISDCQIPGISILGWRCSAQLLEKLFNLNLCSLSHERSVNFHLVVSPILRFSLCSLILVNTAPPRFVNVRESEFARDWINKFVGWEAWCSLNCCEEYCGCDFFKLILASNSVDFSAIYRTWGLSVVRIATVFPGVFTISIVLVR